MDGKFKPMLPLRYRNLANRIKEAAGLDLHIDMGVYSQGKGRQWRRTNVQRENGNYKVWLPTVVGLDVNEILELCKAPGPIPPAFEKVKPNPLLGSWFQSTKAIVDMQVNSEPVPAEKILDSETPECVKNLAANKNVKHNVNSNLLAMQAISYGIARGWDIDQIISYNNKFISEYKSSQYKSPTAFEDHFRSLYDYASERPDKFKFGCKMMLSCVTDVDCNSCQIKIGEAEESYDNIYVKDGGYYLILENPDLPHKKLTNFTLKWQKKILREDGTKNLIFDVICQSSPEKNRQVEVDSEAFLSRANFGKITDMYEVFYGSDKEASMLKLAIAHLNNPQDMKEVGYTGLVWDEDEWHYTTKEGSITLKGTVDLIKSKVDLSMANDTRLNFAAEETRPDEIIQVLNCLLDVNKPDIIIPMMFGSLMLFSIPMLNLQMRQVQACLLLDFMVQAKHKQ